MARNLTGLFFVLAVLLTGCGGDSFSASPSEEGDGSVGLAPDSGGTGGSETGDAGPTGSGGSGGSGGSPEATGGQGQTDGGPGGAGGSMVGTGGSPGTGGSTDGGGSGGLSGSGGDSGSTGGTSGSGGVSGTGGAGTGGISGTGGVAGTGGASGSGGSGTGGISGTGGATGSGGASGSGGSPDAGTGDAGTTDAGEAEAGDGGIPPACNAGDSQCSGTGVRQTCDATGNWIDDPCSGSTPTCYFGFCYECQPDPTPTKCNGNTRQYCNPVGHWQNVSGGACFGTCDQGTCAPVTLASDVTSSFTVDSNYVYYGGQGSTTGSAIRRVPLTGGSSQIVKDNISPFTSLTVGSALYFFQGGSLNTMPLAGGTVTTLANSFGSHFNLILSGSNLYFDTNPQLSTSASIETAPITGGGPTTVVSGLAQAARIIGTDGSKAYFVSGTIVGSVPLTGGTSSVVAYTAGPVGSFVRAATDGTYVYWDDVNGGFNKTPVTGGASQQIVSPGTSTSVVLSVVTDGANIYWVNAPGPGGAIYKVSVNGGTVTALWSSTTAYPTSPVLDSTAIYFTTSDGLLLKTNK